MELGCFESVFLTMFFGYCAIITISHVCAFLREGFLRKQTTKPEVKEAIRY